MVLDLKIHPNNIPSMFLWKLNSFIARQICRAIISLSSSDSCCPRKPKSPACRLQHVSFLPPSLLRGYICHQSHKDLYFLGKSFHPSWYTKAHCKNGAYSGRNQAIRGTNFAPKTLPSTRSSSNFPYLCFNELQEINTFFSSAHVSSVMFWYGQSLVWYPNE